MWTGENHSEMRWHPVYSLGKGSFIKPKIFPFGSRQIATSSGPAVSGTGWIVDGAQLAQRRLFELQQTQSCHSLHRGLHPGLSSTHTPGSEVSSCLEGLAGQEFSKGSEGMAKSSIPGWGQRAAFVEVTQKEKSIQLQNRHDKRTSGKSKWPTKVKPEGASKEPDRCLGQQKPLGKNKERVRA